MEVFIVWVNFYSGEWETALGIYCIFFCVFTFAQIVKEKLYNSVFTTFRKRKKLIESLITAVRRENDV